jgi:hypothetical protein
LVPEGGEEEIHIQVPSDAPSNSVVDSVLIIGTEIQEDLCVKRASTTRDPAATATWDSPMTETWDSPAPSSRAPQIAQGQVSSRTNGVSVEEGSNVGQDPAKGSVVYQNQEVIIQCSVFIVYIHRGVTNTR